MTTNPKITIVFDDKTLTLMAARYGDNGALGLMLVNEENREFYTAVTVNVPGTFMVDPDYDIILDTNDNPSRLLRLVIDTGVVEEEPYGVARSGFCTYPTHALTEKGLKWVEGQLEEK